MAERHKESSPADSKEKSSLLDDDIGKGFLSSWKSMSTADDVALDFSFETVSKSKKKTFDFEKLDMNFNLDDEFDKISSFKLDMSDLDFTCPPKKASQSKDKKGESFGANAGKQDGFNFSFDFNELDSFNLDSSLTKLDTTSNSNLSKKGVTTEGSDSEGSKMPKSNDDECVHASNDSMVVKPRESERLETSKVETSVSNLGELVSRQDGSVSILASSRNFDQPIENQTSDIRTRKSTEVMDQERDLLQKTKSKESKSQQVMNTASSQSVGQSDSERDTISEQHTKAFSSGTRETNISGDQQEFNDKATYKHTKVFSSRKEVIDVSGDKQEVNDEATCADSERIDLQQEHSSPPHTTTSDSCVGDTINLGSSTQEGVTNQPEKSDTSCENINKTDPLKGISCDNEIREDKRTTLECHLAAASSKAVVGKMTLMKDKELQVLHSNMFSMPGDKRSLKHSSSTAGTKGITSFGCKKDADMRLGSITQARESFRLNDIKFGSKLVSDSLPDSGKLMKDAPALLVCKDDPKSCGNTREGIVYDVMPSSGKLAGNMQSFREEVNKSKGTNIETGVSTEDVNMLSSQVKCSRLTEKTGSITTKIFLNSQPEASGKESSLKSKTTPIDGNKLSSFKGCKITPALSSLKTLRSIGANRVLTTSHQKQTNSFACSGPSMEIQGSAALKNDHLTESGDDQKPSTLFLKRKTFEVSEADLTSLRSLKRLTQSPNKSSNSKECPEVVEEESQVQTLESKAGNLLYYHSTSRLKCPSEIKVMEVEIPDSVLMEDNSNVEKAEAYMKELEDICNMLKKKHEEAKELLVRAIVNDNNLLMLNHPIREEEIRKVQKSASQLMSKGIQAIKLDK